MPCLAQWSGQAAHRRGWCRSRGQALLRDLSWLPALSGPPLGARNQPQMPPAPRTPETFAVWRPSKHSDLGKGMRAAPAPITGPCAGRRGGDEESHPCPLRAAPHAPGSPLPRPRASAPPRTPQGSAWRLTALSPLFSWALPSQRRLPHPGCLFLVAGASVPFVPSSHRGS